MMARSSSHEYIADVLDAFKWRAHFFVHDNWIGERGFLSPAADPRSSRA